MSVFVVDTNVAIVANFRDTHADISCQVSCVNKLESLIKREIIVVDDKGLIISEYQKHLKFSGAPGVGDAFFKHVFNHQHGGRRVQRVTILQCADERRGFENLPKNDLDPSDRKFLAVAVASGAVIVNATDSDWGQKKALTDSLNVTVEQLCPQHATR